MGNIVSAASAFRLLKNYLPAHSTFYNAASISLCSFADAARMRCAEAKGLTEIAERTIRVDAARMRCAEAKGREEFKPPQTGGCSSYEVC